MYSPETGPNFPEVFFHFSLICIISKEMLFTAEKVKLNVLIQDSYAKISTVK